MTASKQPTLVITGGHGDLARAISTRFSIDNWYVAAPGRGDLDVTRPDAVTAYFAHQHPDLLICNAGVIRDAPIAKLTESDWQHVIEVNFHGARRCAIAAIKRMRSRQSGHIIFISSNSAIHPPPGQAAYAAAKAALFGLTRGLAIEAGPSGIRINGMLPGFLETKMTSTVSDARRDAVRSTHTLDRFNTPDAVAQFIWHLHHDLPHTSGQIFQLDSRVV
jgi:3-oxoacyl-[acyl-carrier protein] reductase